MFIPPPAIVLQRSDFKMDFGRILEQKIEKKFVYPDLRKEVEVDPASSTIHLRSLIGKPIKMVTITSPDHSASLVWIVGSKDKGRVIIIGIHNSDEVFLVTSTPRIYPKSFNYAELPVWLPLNGGRLLYWGLDSRECSILDVRAVNRTEFIGYDLDALPSPGFQNFDALDPSLSSQIKPYSFSRTGPDDSADIRLFCGGRRLVVKSGDSYLWKH